MLMDFESASIKTLTECFPNIDSKEIRCLFDFGQSLFQKVKEMRSSVKYREHKRSKLNACVALQHLFLLIRLALNALKT